MPEITLFQKAIRDEKLDGWLFTSHHHRDSLSERLLSIPPGAVNTRPWYYLVPRSGEPVKIVHGIEPFSLSHLPGTTVTYTTASELRNRISGLGVKRVAVQYSPDLPVISFLDHGTALRLQEAGLELVSSAALIQRTAGLLDQQGIDSHERAAVHLYEIVVSVWSRIREEYSRKVRTGLTEGRIRDWIEKEFQRRNLETDASPIVASGIRSSDPHYSPVGNGFPLADGEVLQLDLWAKEKAQGSIYADISWVGFIGHSVPHEVSRAFSILCAARDRGVEFIRSELAGGKTVHGADVDLVVRTGIITNGFGSFLKHRTGHGIDTEPHGSGVNLDGVEFPDQRMVLEGSCFSIEPGIYLPQFGLRTEINVYIQNSRPVVSGGTPQTTLLTLQEGQQ